MSPLLAVLAVYGLWSTLTPTPFSYKGDMYILAAPMARFISLSWISGHVPAISWLMGDGFNPWLSGQSGVLYPVYPVAMLLAKLLRREFLLLELTAILDFVLIAYFIFGSPLFRKASFSLRLSLALLFVVQPSAVILGQNWCYFLNSYTWCLISMGNLLAWHRWPTKSRYGWWTLGSLVVLFTAINAQMFPFFMALCVLPVLLVSWRRQWRRQAAFGLLLSLVLVPAFVCIWWASQNGNPAWMTGRDSADSALAFGQTLWTVLKGAVFGNLVSSKFNIWQGVSTWASGIFLLPPAALLGLALARPKERRLWLITGLILLVLMGIASLPFLKWAFIGPFARFRWTWKFAIFIPSVLLGCIVAGRPEKRPRLWMPFILISVGLSLLVSSRGLQVDFFPSQSPIRSTGIRGLLDPAIELKTRLALKPGERLVPIGRMDTMDQIVPMSWLAMIGNAPSLVDIPSLAIYDPLEPASSASLRGGLSTPWREALPDNLDASQLEQVDAYLGPQGAAVYLFKERPRFEHQAYQELRLRNGDVVWAVRSKHWQPWASLRLGEAGPSPTVWGDWPVPAREQMRLATARELTLFPDPGPSSRARAAMKVSPDGFSGPWVLRIHPLGGLGPWVSLWYIGAVFLFLGVWFKRHSLILPLGLPAPEEVVVRVQNLPWIPLFFGMTALFLFLRLPLLLGPQPISDAIIAYPKQIMTMVGQHLAPYREVPFEYPPLALIPLAFSALWADTSVWLFRLGFAAQMFLVDAALFVVSIATARRFAMQHRQGHATALALGAGALYLAATQPLGCLLYDRLDLAVAAFIAFPLLLRFSGVATRPWILGTVIALGFWFKLVPILALAPLTLWEWTVNPDFRRWQRILGLIAGSVLTILAIGLLARGVFGPRLWGFFGYHFARPIEFGTLWASMDFLISGGVRPVFEYGGWHVRGDRLELWKILSMALTFAGLATTLLLGFLGAKRETPVRTCALVALGSVLSFIIFGKVFSPQFLLWLAPLLPVLLWDEGLSPGLIKIIGGCLGAVAITGVYFPDWHYAMVGGNASIWLLVILRNFLCVLALIGVWRQLYASKGERHPAESATMSTNKLNDIFHSFAPTILFIIILLSLMRILGAFPLPWNDELVFATTGLDILQNGRWAEGFAAIYHPSFAKIMVFEPPLYPIFVGVLIKLFHVDLFGLRAIQGVLSLVLLDRLIRGWWSRAKPDLPYVPKGMLVFLAIAMNPYFLRAAFFLRPDIFIVLALLWLMGSIWEGRFLSSTRQAVLCGILFGLSALLHFSAILLIPIFVLGVADAWFHRHQDQLPSRVGKAFLSGFILLSPYLVYLAVHWVEWRSLVLITQGEKFHRGQTIWSYLVPSTFLAPHLNRGWPFSPSAWGSRLTAWLWIVFTVAIPVFALVHYFRKATNHRRHAVLLLLFGMSGTWFYVYLPEMWFSSLALLSIQGVLMLLLLISPSRTIQWMSSAWIAVHLFCLLHHWSTVPTPTWIEYEDAGSKLVNTLEPLLPTGRERIYISALPDVSLRLLQRWPHLQITRGIEFDTFSDLYERRILQEGFVGYIVTEPYGRGPNGPIPRRFQFDWNNALYEACLRRDLDVQAVSMGGFHVWLLTPVCRPSVSSAPWPPPNDDLARHDT